MEVEAGNEKLSRSPEVRAAITHLQQNGEVALERDTRPGMMRADALTIARSIQVSRGEDPSNAGLRDRALIAIGFHGCLTNLQIAAIDVSHVQIGLSGDILLKVRRPQGTSAWIILPQNDEICLDPRKTLVDWLNVRTAAAGALFTPIDRHDVIRGNRLSTDAIGHIVSRRAQDVGLRFPGAQSFRNGAVAQLAAQHRSIEEIGAELGYVETVHLRPLVNAVYAERRKQPS